MLTSPQGSWLAFHVLTHGASAVTCRLVELYMLEGQLVGGAVGWSLLRQLGSPPCVCILQQASLGLYTWQCQDSVF
jgi:hypothetical protein